MFFSILARGTMTSRPQPGAADLEIHAHTQHIKTAYSAGMGLFGEDLIPNANVHRRPPFVFFRHTAVN